VQALAAGWREDPDTLPLLRHLANADPHEYVRQAAARWTLSMETVVIGDQAHPA
jgi:hypothetical protein